MEMMLLTEISTPEACCRKAVENPLSDRWVLTVPGTTNETPLCSLRKAPEGGTVGVITQNRNQPFDFDISRLGSGIPARP